MPIVYWREIWIHYTHKSCSDSRLLVASNTSSSFSLSVSTLSGSVVISALYSYSCSWFSQYLASLLSKVCRFFDSTTGVCKLFQMLTILLQNEFFLMLSLEWFLYILYRWPLVLSRFLSSNKSDTSWSYFPLNIL